METQDIETIKKNVNAELEEVTNELKKGASGVSETIAGVAGLSGGSVISLTALSTLGISGMSVTGLSSSLATAGAIVGGGLFSGIGLLAAPVLVLGVAGYAIAKRRKHAQKIITLNQAIRKLYNIQTQLQSNAEYFKKELTGVQKLLDFLESEREK